MKKLWRMVIYVIYEVFICQHSYYG